MIKRVKDFLNKEIIETKKLLQGVPAMVMTLFVVSVVCMNLLANKTLIKLSWIALDAGILISWLAFMCMDIITKHFGAKAANKISVMAATVNLFVCIIFFIASAIPSDADDYSSFDKIFGGTWFILLGSTIAFLLSSCINNFLNSAIGKMFKRNPDGKLAFAMSAYISTFVGKFFDNLIFSVVVFVWFAPVFWDGFHWTVKQCTVCAVAGALAELGMEILFFPLGYNIILKWKKNGVGKEYLDYVTERRK